jgi:penicillin-binding protein 1A
MLKDKMFRSPDKRPKNLPAMPSPRMDFKKIIIYTAILSLGLILLGSASIMLLYLSMKKDLPSVEQLENIEPSLITKVYSADDTLLKEFYTERRIWRTLDEIPPFVYNAVISIEDKRFWQHWGMNVYTLPDIFIKTIFFSKSMRGGSTLTQQLARNLYASIGRRRSIVRKIKELFTAMQIEKTYTKSDILQFYINQVYMGGGAYGFQAAAQKFFGKNTLNDLTVAEAAVLAAVIQRPEFFRPDLRPENTIKRRDLVLKSMVGDGHITDEEFNAAVAETLAIAEFSEKSGKAPYFVEHVRRSLEKKYGAKTLYTSGYTVRTTLNYMYQKKAEEICFQWLDSLQRYLNRKFIRELGLVKRFRMPQESIAVHLDSFSVELDTLFKNVYSDVETELDSAGMTVKKLLRPALHDSLKYRKVQVAMATLDNKTGAVLTMVGGRNFEESKFNRVTQAFRQPGSAFKPFIYTAAMDNNYTPASIMLDQAFSLKDPIKGEWRPNNYTREFLGEVTLRHALALSVNTIAIKLQQKVGTATVINYAVNMGLSRKHLSPVPSLAIGACEATPLSLFSAYSAFANGGIRVEPYAIEEIYDRDENLVEKNYPVMHNVLNPKTAYIMVSLLRSVVTGGTAIKSYSKGVKWPAGGKTGTTNDYTDAWFVGFTPLITCGVWTGVDEKRSLGYGRTGSYGALPIWTDFMLYVYDSLKALKKQDFPSPGGIFYQKICRVSHKIAREDCDSIYHEIFIIGTEPDVCTDDHSVKRQYDENTIDPFGSHQRRSPTEPNGEKKKKRQKIFMM